MLICRPLQFFLLSSEDISPSSPTRPTEDHFLSKRLYSASTVVAGRSHRPMASRAILIQILFQQPRVSFSRYSCRSSCIPCEAVSVPGTEDIQTGRITLASSLRASCLFSSSCVLIWIWHLVTPFVPLIFP